MANHYGTTFSSLVMIKGAGDLATGVAHRLITSGFPVLMTEIPQPTVVRRTASFAEAVFRGATEVEGITARLISDPKEAPEIIVRGDLPVLVDPQMNSLETLKPQFLVEATVCKKNTGVLREKAPVVIALGPSFTAGEDVDAVVETKRGHYLGKTLYQGSAAPNSGEPGSVDGYTKERVLYAPASGAFQEVCRIGDQVESGDTVAFVDNEPVKAKITGTLRGLLSSGLQVKQGMKAGDVDPRCSVNHCWTISDKARAVGGGVMEGMLALAGSALKE